jgi:formate hydrogenlyase transcriptional activator
MESMIQSKIKPESDPEKQVQFKSILLEISTFFINIPPDQIDDQIINSQARICELLNIDRSTLWEVSEGNGETLELTHIHQPPGSRPTVPRMSGNDFFPWAVQNVLGGKLLVISKMTDLPPEADRDLESWRLYETKSTVCIPLSVGGGPIFGVLVFAVICEERIWTDEIVEGFQIIAQIFANALARKKAEKELRQNNLRLNLATEGLGVGLWDMELDTGDVWATKKNRELFYLNPDEKLTYKSFFRLIHPEDHETVHNALQHAIHSGEEFLIEYRIVSPDGTIHWIASRGKAYIKSTEGSDRLIGLSIDITERKQMENQLRERLYEITELKRQLEIENIYLREEIKLQEIHEDIVGRSSAMRQVLAQVEQVARTETTVLIEGETGVGKELIARALHRLSIRKDRPMVTVNCASLPPTLMESELFGREKGAYTGAMTRMTGRFELADGATLFLDEIGELPKDVQAKLLRVLEEGCFERLGSNKTLKVDVRIIAATNRDLTEEVAKGNFRKDLFYRLNVFPIHVPPLRDRPEDISPLVWKFVRQHEAKMGTRIEHIPRRIMEYLTNYSWPGNARELRNIIEYSMIVTKGKTLEVQIPEIESSESSVSLTLEDVARKHIMEVLRKTDWRITGLGGAAEILGLKRTTLQSKIKKLGIHRSQPDAEIKS